MPVIKCLEKILADSYALYFKTQNYHWNIEGKTFLILHSLFEKQYQDLAEALDMIAERIRTLGSKVATLSHILTLSSIQECHSNVDADEMLKDLIDDQATIIETLYTGLKTAQKKGDEGTADMIISRIRIHEKNQWMLNSSL